MTDIDHLIAAIEKNGHTIGGKPLSADRVFPSADSQRAALRAAKVILQERDELADALAAALREQYKAGLVSMEPSRDPARDRRSED